MLILSVLCHSLFTQAARNKVLVSTCFNTSNREFSARFVKPVSLTCSCSFLFLLILFDFFHPLVFFGGDRRMKTHTLHKVKLEKSRKWKCWWGGGWFYFVGRLRVIVLLRLKRLGNLFCFNLGFLEMSGKDLGEREDEEGIVLSLRAKYFHKCWI